MPHLIKKFLPGKVYRTLLPYYHLSLAFISAFWYRFPSKKIKVVAVTGTKGKTTTTELVSSLLEAGGYKTAIISTLRFKVADDTKRNLLKMTTPGRGMVQKILREAVNKGCHYAVIEVSSEGAKQYRHKFIEFDALIFTNLSPEHIESHGSYENYINAKLGIARTLQKSSKKNKTLVVNTDDPESEKFLAFNIKNKIKYYLKDAEPFNLSDHGMSFSWQNQTIESVLVGEFNLYNILAAAEYARSEGISIPNIKIGIENFTGVLGRMQKVYADNRTAQHFDVIVDYAHTAESLRAAYSVYSGKRKIICVLGSCGGGRDKWKRPAMGKIANDYCSEIILTNEDPYDEDPDQIICEVAAGIEKNYDVIIDRKEAIKEAISRAEQGDVVMITGKGTDPYLMGARNKKTPWSDAGIAEEILNTRFS